MTGQPRQSGALWRGPAIALALSVGFLGLTVVASPAVAALVAVPASLVVSVLRTRAVARPAHVLAPTAFERSAVIAAPKASTLVVGTPEGPASATSAA